MKVVEKNCDRRAEAHIYIEEKVDALEEYGEYIETRDKAICCYVPVEEGHKVKIGGKSTGTTLVIAYDAVVDGVYRKASSYVAKNVQLQKSKKIDTETFLCKTQEGVVDTDMTVAPLEAGLKAKQGGWLETIGTLELRLYVTRQVDVSHALGSIKKYNSIGGNVEDDDDLQPMTYRHVPPSFQMAFNHDSSTLDKGTISRQHRKFDARRPGTEPWAIFRFHYRSKDAIFEHFTTLTYDPTSKAKTDAHTLDLEPVPPLPINTAPHKDDGDASTRASTPMAPDTPLANGAQKEQTPKSPTISKKQPPKSTTTPGSTPDMTSTTDKEIMPAPESAQNTATEVPAAVIDKVATDSDGDKIMTESATTEEPAGEEKAKEVKKPKEIEKSVEIAKEKLASDAKEKPASEVTKNTAIAKEKPPTETEVTEKDTTTTASDTIAVAIPVSKSAASTNGSAAKLSSPPQTTFKPVSGATTKTITSAKEPGKKSPQVVIPSTKKPATKPAPVPTPAPAAQKKTPAAPTTVTPTKRTAEPTTVVATPEPKRTKVIPTPPVHATPTTPTIVSRIPPGSASPHPMSVERKVAEQRKKLEALRLKRLETAKKQEALDKQMEPYKKRMAEELERLNQEMMEEEAAAAEDEEHFNASVEMLAEFENGDGGH